MKRRSATPKFDGSCSKGKRSSSSGIAHSSGTVIDVKSIVILQKFDLLSRNGSLNIAFHDYEFDHSFDEYARQDSCMPSDTIANCLEHLSMVNLSIIGWSLRERTIPNLSTAFHHLHSLGLRDCKMGPGDCSLLSNALTFNRSIKVLDLSDNRIVGIYSSRNQIFGDHDTSGFAAILSALLRSSTVEHLNLSSNYLGGVRCSYTSPSGRRLMKCASFVAKPDEISKSGFITASMIEEFLFFNQSVCYLNLNNNEFQNDDNIAQSLLSHTHHHTNNCDKEDSSKRRNSLRVVNNKRRRFFEIYDTTNHLSTPTGIEGSPCRTLCGIIPSSSRSDYHDLQYSSFHPPVSDHADLSNLCLEPSTGILLGEFAYLEASILVKLFYDIDHCCDEFHCYWVQLLHILKTVT